MTTINQPKVTIKRIFSDAWMSESNLKKAYISAKDTLCFPLDRKTKRKRTGFEHLSAKEIAEFEKELRFRPGQLSDPEFLADYCVQIPSEGLTLDLSVPEDLLRYYLLSALSFVAKNIGELKLKNKTSVETLYLMSNPEEEAEAKNTSRKFVAKSWALYDEMGVDEMRDVLYFLGRNPKDMSEKVIREKVGDEIENNPKKFAKIVQDPLFKDTVFIKKCINYDLLQQRGNSISQDGQVLAVSLEDAIEYFNEPKNQSAKVALLASLQDKDKGKPSKTKKAE
jgi:hypothetical protein